MSEENPPSGRSTGVATPLAALRRPGSGIGEYTDLRGFGEWAADCGFDTIQVLPLSDTGEDPSPYAGIASVGLHPIHLDLDDLADREALGELSGQYRQAQAAAAARDRVDYRAVLRSKGSELRRLFESQPPERWRRELEGFAYANPWVHELAAFHIASDREAPRPWWDWTERRDPDPADLASLLEGDESSWLYHCWLQMHADRQLTESLAALDELGIELMGDMPILVQKNSADVWAHRELFDLSAHAGAPPDLYCPDGQDWGFPLYRWDRHRESDYAWWQRRLEHAARYYRVLRIDHVLGFFRIWAIAEGESALQGHYRPRMSIEDEALAAFDARRIAEWSRPGGIFETIEEGRIGLRHEWQKSPLWADLDDAECATLRGVCERADARLQECWGALGRERLAALQSMTDLSFCAEDLGAVPPCVPRVLEELGIPGLKVERWCRAEDEEDRPFWDPAHFPRRSVCAPGLHDASSIRGWWQEIDDQTRALYYYRAIDGAGPVPEDLDPVHLARVFARNLRAASERVIFQLPDVLALDEGLRPNDPEDERINWPGTIQDRNWSWRMPICVDELAGRASLTARWKALVAERRA